MGLYKRKGSPFYWMSFKVKRRRVFESTETSNKKKAEEIYAKKLSELLDGKWFPEKAPKKSLKDLIERYSAEYLPKKKDQAREKSIFKQLVRFFGEDILLEELEATLGMYEVKRTKEKRAPATIHKEISLLRRMLNIAMKRWRWIKENPVSFIDLPKVNNSRCRYLSEREYATLFEALDSAPEAWLKPVIKIALNTGLRQSNIIYMRWSWVNLKDRLIMISGEHMKNNQNLGIPLTQEAYDTLKDLGKVRLTGTDLVFHEEGKTIYPVKLQRAFKVVCTAAKLTDFRFHDLRHTYASYLRQRGVDLHTISVLLSHRDTRMSARYAHLSVESLRDAVAVLDRKRLQFGDIGKEKGATHSVTP